LSFVIDEGFADDRLDRALVPPAREADKSAF